MRYQNYKRIVLSTLTAFLLSGCVGGMGIVKKDVSPPSWYINAPSNDTLHIYGEGVSSNLKEAKENALNSMASKLVVSVASSIQTKTNTSINGNNQTYNKDISKDLKIDVQKMKFTNATVLKSKNIEKDFYILMQVDRQELFSNNKKEFDILDRRVTQQFDSLKNYGKLDQILILQDIYPKIKDAKKKAVVLNAINNQFDHGPYISRYDRYIDAIKELKNSSSISVITNSSEKYFADALIDMLNQKKYKISQKSSGDILIELNNKVKYSVARGWNIAKVSTVLSVISNGKIVSNRVINSVGRSSTSKESALDDASSNFLKQIQNETLDKVIFSK